MNNGISQYMLNFALRNKTFLPLTLQKKHHQSSVDVIINFRNVPFLIIVSTCFKLLFKKEIISTVYIYSIYYSIFRDLNFSTKQTYKEYKGDEKVEALFYNVHIKKDDMVK